MTSKLCVSDGGMRCILVLTKLSVKHLVEPSTVGAAVGFGRERIQMIDRKTSLLAAAVEEIARCGTRGMRVDEVAKRAGVSVSLIYHHFNDRSTLLQAALDHIGSQADDYTKHTDGTGRENVLATLLDEIQDSPTVRTNSAAWGELRDCAVFDDALRPTIEKQTARWNADLAELIRSGQQDGSIGDACDADRLASVLTATTEGVSGRWLAGILTTDDARQHIQLAVDVLLDAADRSGA